VIAEHRTDRKTLGWALALAFALLLKAAVPLLAVAAADAQGKALFEVCSAYGVRTVVLDEAPAAPQHPADDAAAHGGEHCVLASLLLLGGSAPPAFTLAPAPASAPATAPAAAVRPHDANARWLAGLKHAPPARA
jgi:hypothetical protein